MNEIQNPNQPSNSHELITDYNTDKMKTAEYFLEEQGLTKHDQHEGYILKVEEVAEYINEYAQEYAEQYSQQQACEFSEWLGESFYMFNKLSGLWINVNKIHSKDKTTSELYQQWKGEANNG